VRELCAISGAAPGDVVAALGPAIGRCCYMVGEEVREAFLARWGAADTRRILGQSAPWRLDLQGANLLQLREAGVSARNTAALSLCTSCRADLFHSYLRDGRRSGRMLSFVTAAEKGPSAASGSAHLPAAY
jgi:hypothetical protein